VKAVRFSLPYADEAIVAWLDGEMHADEAQAFAAELKRSEALSARTAELMKSNQPFAEAFAAMLDEAPLDRMQQRVAYLLATTPPVPKKLPVQFSRRTLIAASVSFLLVGSGVGFLARPVVKTEPGESEKIRELEAQYMSLYSPETLADIDSSPPVLARSLARTARDLDLHLTPAQLALPEASLKSVRMLRYDDVLITQIAWSHSSYGPMALCISREDHLQSTDLMQEKRQGMNLVWWHRAGYQYVLIGRNPAEQLKKAAQALTQAMLS
jgi:anti-sigma factor RsiW